MAELVDAHDSKSCIFGCAGSIPAFGTLKQTLKKSASGFCFYTKFFARYGPKLTDDFHEAIDGADLPYEEVYFRAQSQNLI